MKFYKVGGCIRDSIMGIKPKDIDYAVECDSFKQLEEYVSYYGKIHVSKPEYLTVRGKVNGEDADYVMCRKDGTYSDNRRPDSVTPGTIYDDLARRDFTMNAIAIDAFSGDILDPHNGRKDIESKEINCVGLAKDRFKEDPLRILRAIRFSITKDFRLSHDIMQYITYKPNIQTLDSVSIERIREELDKMFRYDTMKTLFAINQLNFLHFYLFEDRLWLKPTLEAK